MWVKKILTGLSRPRNPLTVHLLEEIESEFNGKIQVLESMGSKTIIAGGLIQSGGVLRDIWEKGLNSVKGKPANGRVKIKNVLVLGLSGGTAARLATEKWPRATITGIEIDPLMIDLGKKHFGLSELSQLETVNEDAFAWLPSLDKNRQFDLVLVDLYLGDKICRQSEEKAFLKELKQRLNPKGVVIFNRLYYEKHKDVTEDFVTKIARHFKNVNLIRAWSNLLVMVSNGS